MTGSGFLDSPAASPADDEAEGGRGQRGATEFSVWTPNVGRRRLQNDGVSPAGGRPEQFREAIRKEIEVWRKVVSEAGVKAE